ncbi:MAG: preprotein translocase subunit SecG, partial [Spirochaetia bacterium]|nr:preprotein translocase subunit SecG [Spirochaetia bacterium]
MGVLGIVFFVLFIIISIFLIFLVVIQNENAQGLGGIFGGTSDTTFGSNSGNILTKITYIAAGAFLVLSFVFALMNRTPEDSGLLADAQNQQLTENQEWWNEPAESEDTENNESTEEDTEKIE